MERTVHPADKMGSKALEALFALLLLSAGCLQGTSPPSTTAPPEASWTDGRSINSSALAEHHFQQLRQRGSFTENHSETIRIDGEPRPDGPRPDAYHPPSYTRKLVNLDTGRYLDTFVTVGHRRSNHFITPGVTARRQKACPNCSYEYSYQQRPETDTRSKRIDVYRSREPVRRFARFLRGVTVGFNYTYTGTVERDGERLYRYRAERNLSIAPPPFSEPPYGTATILVTDEGFVRQFRLQYEGEAVVTVNGEGRTVSVTHTFVRTYTDVGETTVDRPQWVDGAAGRATARETETGDR